MEYTVIRSPRKTVSLEITADCRVIIRAPMRFSDREAEAFYSKHSVWVEEKLKIQEKKSGRNLEIEAAKNRLYTEACAVIPRLAEYYSGIMKLYHSSVKITSAKTRFGSCGPNNSLCFSWRLMAYPPEAVEYVVVHELAHIKHRNHGREFYALVEKYLPDYKERAGLLKA